MSGRRWGYRCCISALFSFAALLWLAGCGGAPQPTRLSESVGTVMATLTLHPDPAVPMQDTTLTIELQDGGQPVVGATVAMTLTMPGCPMAPSYPALKDEGDGLYRVQTVLTMAGAWRADARITLPGGQEMPFTFFFATR
jgi:metal-sulfur cluster biosynthetic enzyme